MYVLIRAVARSENPGGHVVLGGDNVPPPLVETGLTDLSKRGGGGTGPPACDRPGISWCLHFQILNTSLVCFTVLCQSVLGMPKQFRPALACLVSIYNYNSFKMPN